ncbi:MAG: tetratricopeptide repeat protein [Deltaproteobacteria bacterium]|nr:tetratricopeptide repeat protein [Deltaproteobacteria bacterium]
MRCLAVTAVALTMGFGSPARAAQAGSEAAYQKLIASARKSYIAAHLKAAATDFRNALALKPQGAEALIGLGLVLAEQSPLEAIPLLEKGLEKEPANARAHAMLGTAFQSVGRERDAARAYRKYLELSPQGELAGELRTIIERLDPNGGQPPAQAASATADYRQGLLLFESKEYEEAAKVFEAVLKGIPSHADAHKLLGTCYAKTRRFDLAAREYEEFVHLAPADPQASRVTRLLKDYFAANPSQKPRYPLP